MSHFHSKTWIQLVSDEQLQQLRQKTAQAGGWHGVREHLWRQIEVQATSAGVRVELGDVNEEAACGGYWSGASTVRTVKMTWDDLCDPGFLMETFKREPMFVYIEIMGVLNKLRENMPMMRQLLATV